MAIPPLTDNAIQRILNGEKVPNPVLQILAYKKVPGDGKKQTRFRFIMSDGTKSHQCFVMIGDHLIHRTEKGDFERNTVIRLEEYECDVLDANKESASHVLALLTERVFISTQILVMKSPVVLMSGKDVGAKIGNPTKATEQIPASQLSGMQLQQTKGSANEDQILCSADFADLSQMDPGRAFAHVLNASAAIWKRAQELDAENHKRLGQVTARLQDEGNAAAAGDIEN